MSSFSLLSREFPKFISFNSITNGNLQEIKEKLFKGYRLPEKDCFEEAILRGHLELAKYLYSLGKQHK